jgi:hypothetical protein
MGIHNNCVVGPGVHKGVGHVVVLNEIEPNQVEAKVYLHLSLGTGQDDDPICVAMFKCANFNPSGCGVEESVVQDLSEPNMFSHLNYDGKPVYQCIDGHLTIKYFVSPSVADINLDYGPNLVSRCVPVDPMFKPVGLMEQERHCDGNYYHAKGQWVAVDGDKPPAGHGFYRVSEHVPFLKEREMEKIELIEPLVLKGTPHMNSMSFVFNVNGGTTITYPPPESTALRTGNIVEETPFGGLSAFR